MKEKKSVWLINYTGRKGGGPLDSIMMTKGLLQNNISVVAIVSSQIENLSEWQKLPLEKLVVINTYENSKELVANTILFNRRHKKYILEELKEFYISVIYCPMITFWTRKINHLFEGAEVIEVVHDPIAHSGENYLIKKMNVDAIKEADKIIVHSKMFVDYIMKTYNKPTYYIPLGRQNIYADCENKIRLIDYEKDSVNFLFFGTFSYYKGLNVLATAYRKLCEENQESVSLTVIGSGDFTPYAKNYQNLPNLTVINRWIKDEEVENIFIGPNLVCVCPYLDATQSGAVLLAQEYGVPVIATRTGGLEEQMVDGKNGILVNPSNVDELKEAMQRMMKDKQLRRQISMNQKEEIKKLNWDVLAEQLVKIVPASNYGR